MPRLHLFEWEDFDWFPESIRNYGTDVLQFIANKGNIYKQIIPILIKGIKNSKTNQIVDLGSGGGGGLLKLNEELLKQIPLLEIILTDYFPNIPAFKYTQQNAPNMSYVDYSVDAKNVPKQLQGLLTLFLCFHHFQPNDAKLILQNAVDNNRDIAIIEAQERSIVSFFTLFFMPVLVLLITLFIKPFSFKRIFFTYIFPIVPLFVWWDGLVSALRTYSIKEMNQMVSSLKNNETYKWEIGKVKTYFGVNLYLLGIKKNYNET